MVVYNQWVDLYRFTPEVRVKFQATDVDRRFRSQYFIIKVLEEDLAENPKDTRFVFPHSPHEPFGTINFVFHVCTG
jgi:hypothetical protein